MKPKIRIPQVIAIFFFALLPNLISAQKPTTAEVMSGVLSGLEKIQDIQKLKNLRQNIENKVANFRSDYDAGRLSASDVAVIRDRYLALSVSYNHFFQVVKADALSLRNITKIERLGGNYQVLTDSIQSLAVAFESLTFNDKKGMEKTIPPQLIAQGVTILFNVGKEIHTLIKNNKEYKEMLTTSFDALSYGFFEKLQLRNFDQLWPGADKIIVSTDGSISQRYGLFSPIANGANNARVVYDPNISPPYTDSSSLGGALSLYKKTEKLENIVLARTDHYGTHSSQEVYNANHTFASGDVLNISLKTQSLFIYVYGRDNLDLSGTKYDLLYPFYNYSKPEGIKKGLGSGSVKSIKMDVAANKSINGDNKQRQYLKNLSPSNITDVAMIDNNNGTEGSPFIFKPGDGLQLGLTMDNIGSSEQLFVIVSRSELTNPIEFVRNYFTFDNSTKNLKPTSVNANVGAIDYSPQSQTVPVLEPVSKILKTYIINMQKQP